MSTAQAYPLLIIQPSNTKPLLLASATALLLHASAGYWLYTNDVFDSGASENPGIGGLTIGVGQRFSDADLQQIQQRLKHPEPEAVKPPPAEPIIKELPPETISQTEITLTAEKQPEKKQPEKKQAEIVKAEQPRPAQSASRASTGSATDQSNGGQQGQTQAYLADILRWLERHKRYPRKAKHQGVEGVAQLSFSVARNGQVVQQQIQKTSGSGILDRAAQRLLQQASPLPPVPDSLQPGRTTLKLVIPVVYKIQ